MLNFVVLFAAFAAQLFQPSHCNPLDERDVDGNRIWKKAKCQTRPIALRYCGFWHEKPLVVELLESNRKALFFRSHAEECEHLFAVPLPFEVRDVTCTKTVCLILKDDVDNVEGSNAGNLYRLDIANVIGGFTDWLLLRQRQRKECSGLTGVAFNYTDVYQSSNTISSNVGNEMCQVFLQQIPDIRNYLNMTEEYMLDVAATLLKGLTDAYHKKIASKSLSLQAIAESWLQWIKMTDSTEKFFSFGESTANARVAAITANNKIVYIQSLYPLKTQSSENYGTSVTSFNTNMKTSPGLVNLILITLEKKLAYIQQDQRPEIIASADGLFRLYERNGTVYAIGADRTLYYSDTLISVILTHHGFCQSGTVYVHGIGCMSFLNYHDSLYDKNEICAGVSSTTLPYSDGYDDRLFTAFSRYNGTHSYRVLPYKLTFSDAKLHCQANSADLVTLKSKQKLIEVSSFLEERIRESPAAYALPGTSDFIFWIESHQDPSGCCYIEDAERVPCETEVNRANTWQSMGCCIPGTGKKIPYEPKHPDECMEDFHFFAKTTLHGGDGESVNISERFTADRCMAIVYNPVLGINFAHRAFNCDMKFNYVCERESIFQVYPEHQYVEPNDRQIVQDCTKDDDVRYNVMFGCNGDVSCTDISPQLLGFTATISRPPYTWTFRSSYSAGLPAIGDEISRSCKSKYKIVAKEDCGIRPANERRYCHNWHDNIRKQECIAHGCCWDDFVNPSSGTIQCYGRVETGAIGESQQPAGRTMHKAACSKGILLACDYRKCVENAQCTSGSDQHRTYTCTCNEGYTGDGLVQCIPVQSCLPGWERLTRTGSCIQLTPKHELMFPTPWHNDYFYSAMKCNRKGADLLGNRTLAKVQAIEEISDPIGLTGTGISVVFHTRTNLTHVTPGCITGYQCEATADGNVPLYYICNAATLNTEPLHQIPCWREVDAICEMIGGPLYLFVQLESGLIDEDTFGYVRIRVLPEVDKHVILSKEMHSCAVLQAYDYLGFDIGSRTYCNHNGKTAMETDAKSFFDEVIPKSYYFAIIAHPRFHSTSDVLPTKIAELGVNIPEYPLSSFKEKVRTIPGTVYKQQEDESLAKCTCTKSSFSNGVNYLGSVIHSVNGTWQCNLYFDGEPDETPEMNVTVFENSESMVRWIVSKEPFDTNPHTIQCPHHAVDVRVLEVNAALTGVGDGVSYTGTCQSQPCVMQLICHGFVSGSSEYHRKSDDTGFQLFCRQFHNEVVRCPILRQLSIADAHVTDVIKIPRPNDRPVYLNMDDILYFGAPSIAYSSIFDRDDTHAWRPLEWTFLHGKYPHAVAIGVRNRAVRFNGQEARTYGDLCWGRLGSEYCQFGTSISLWLSIVRFPTSSHLRILDTGVWNMVEACGGLSVFVDPVNSNLHVAVVENERMWHLDVPTTKQRWIHFVAAWSEADGLYVNLNKGEFVRYAERYEAVPRLFRGNISDSQSNFTCEESLLRIGNYQDQEYRDGSFEIDDVYIFPEALDQDVVYEIAGLGQSIPLRHEIAESILLSNGKDGTESDPDDGWKIVVQTSEVGYNNTETPLSLEFNDTCLGSFIRCYNGLTIGVWIRLSDTATGAENVTDTIVGNMLLDGDGNETFGFLLYIDNAENGDGYDLKFTSFTNESSSISNNDHRLAQVEKGHSYFLIIQLSHDGIWRYCFERTTDCQILTTATYGPSDFRNSGLTYADPLTKLYIGPTRADQFGAFTVNVSIIEEDMDLVAAFDDFHKILPSNYFPLVSGVLTSTDGLYEFQIMGDGSLLGLENFKGVKFGPNGTSVDNDFSEIAWLEIPYAKLLGIHCLADIDHCADGFTIQFWLLKQACDSSQVASSSGICVHIMNMPSVSDRGKGFAVYSVASSRELRVLVQTSESRCEAIINWINGEFGLLRFSWHPVAGLNIFINDVLQVEQRPETNPALKIISNGAPLVVGCGSEDNNTCSVMAIKHLHYWDGTVAGKPFIELENFCSPTTIQVGESCLYTVNHSLDYHDAYDVCHENGGYFGSIHSLPHFTAYAELRTRVGIDSKSFWTDLVRVADGVMIWRGLGISIEETGYFKIHSYVASSQYTFFAIRWELFLSDPEHPTSFAVCENPYSQDTTTDISYYGCVRITKLPLSDAHTLDLRGATGTNAHGTYNFPIACMKACVAKYGSLTVAVSQGSCVCFDSSYTVRASTVPVVDWFHCKSKINDGKMSLAYFEKRENGRLHENHCGPIQLRGAQRCNGSWDDAVSWSTDNKRYLSVYRRANITAKTRSELDSASFALMKPDESNDLNDFETYDIVKFGIGEIWCISETEYPVSREEDPECKGVMMNFLLDFDDGTVEERTSLNYEQAKDLIIFHYYTTPGQYRVQVNLTSVPDGKVVTVVKEITLTVRPHQIRLSHLLIPFGQPEESIEVTVTAARGNSMRCYWSDEIKRLRKQMVVSSLPIPVLSFQYKDAGYYRFSISCKNPVSQSGTYGFAVIDAPVDLLSAQDNVVIDYKDNLYEHEWTVFGGTNVMCRVFMGNVSVPELKSDGTYRCQDIPKFSRVQCGDDSIIYDDCRSIGCCWDHYDKECYSTVQASSNFTFDPMRMKGKAYFAKNMYYVEGTVFRPATYIVSVMCYNSATDPIPKALTYLLLEESISDLDISVNADKTYLIPNEKMTIFASVKDGKNVRLSWDFDQSPEENFVEICGFDECAKRKARIKFPTEGIYNVTVKASNALSMVQRHVAIRVEVPITLLQIHALNVTMASDPVQIVLKIIDDDAAIPTPGVVVLKYSGTEESDREALIFDQLTRTFSVFHRFKEIGLYTVDAYTYNNVSSFNTSASVRVGEMVHGLQISVASSRFLRRNVDVAEIHVTVAYGSEIAYKLKFGDEHQTLNEPYTFKENATRKLSTEPDFNVIFHYYRESGNYTCSVTAENIYGTEEAFLQSNIIVQNPLDDMVVLIPGKVDTVPFPPGNVSLPASLKFSGDDAKLLPASSLLGYANDVDMAVYLGKEVLIQAHGAFEIDLFAVNISLTAADVGNVRISLALNNLVSSAQYTYGFVMSEVIEKIVALPKVGSNDGKLTVHDDGTFAADIITKRELILHLATEKGSHVRYTVSFGDGTPNTTVTSLTLFGSERFVEVKHSFDHPGIYDLTIEAYNDISNETMTIPQCVRAFDAVQVLAYSEYYVTTVFDYDSDTLEELQFDEKALLAQFKNDKYLPTNKTLVVTSQISGGSNATFTWTLAEAGVKLMKTENGIDVIDLSDETVLQSLNTDFEINGITVGLDKSPLVQSPLLSILFVRWKSAGRHVIDVEASNPVSSLTEKMEFHTQETVQATKIEEYEPPLANYTSNISLTIDQISSEPCVLLNWGDGTRPVSFGFDQELCESDYRLSESDFHFVEPNINDTTDEHGYPITMTFTGGGNHSSPCLIVTLPHNFVYEGVYVAKVLIFNRVSSYSLLQDIVVIEVACDYPKVFLDKMPTNSRFKPREVLKSLALKLYSTSKTRCLVSSETKTTWALFKEVSGKADEDNISEMIFDTADQWLEGEGLQSIREHVSLEHNADTHHYEYVPGLRYTAKSDILRVGPRFLDLGMHLICLNVGMVGVYGVSTTDCIYLKVYPTPLVPGVLNGNARTVGHDEVITVTGLGASYDPDIESPDTSGKDDVLGRTLFYQWSGLFLANTSSGEYTAGVSKSLFEVIFSSKKEPKEITACLGDTVDLVCPKLSRFNLLNITAFSSTTGQQCNDTDLLCPQEAVSSNLQSYCAGKTVCNWEMSDLIFGPGALGSGYSRGGNLFHTSIPARFKGGKALSELDINSSDDDGQDSSSWEINGNVTHDCITMAYICDMLDDFSYFEPSNPCMSGGYFTQEQDVNISASVISLRNDTDLLKCPSLEIDASKLEKDLKYVVYVKVSDPLTHRSAISYQLLEIQEGAPPSLRIECLYNCKARINSFKVLSLRAACLTCRSAGQISYQWRVYEENGNNGTYTLMEDFENRTTTGTNIPALVLKSQSFLPGKRYRIKVVGSREGYLDGMTTADVSVNVPPEDGQCDITPQEGNCVNDTFTIHCWDWTDEGVNEDTTVKDKSVTLKYEIWYQKHSKEVPYLLSSGNNPIVADKYLAPGIKEEDYWVTIQVHVVDEFGDKATQTLRARVYEDLNTIGDALQNMTTLTIASSGAQAMSEFSQMAGEILNAQASREGNQTTGDKGATSGKESRSKLRAELVKAVTGKTSYENNLEGVQQASSALKSLIAAPDEVGNDTQLDAVNALSDMTSSLNGIAGSEAPEEIEEAASNLVGALDLVVDAAREQFISAAAVDNGVPQYSLPPPSTESPKAILNEEENYLSPEERLEYRKEKELRNAALHAQNRDQARKVGSSAIGSIDSLSATLMSRKQPGEPSVKLVGKDMTVEVERKTAKTLCEDGGNKKSFSLPCGSDLLNGLGEDETIDVELVVADKNPLIWDDSADSINSAVVSLNLNLPDNRKINSTSRDNPFRIEVPTKKTKYSPPELHVFDPSGVHDMSHHEIVLQDEKNVMFLTIAPEIDTDVRLYFELADNLTVFPNVENNSLVLDLKQTADNPLFPNRVRLDADILGGIGRYVFGIHETDDSGNIVDPANMTWRNYTLHTVVTSCRYWNENTEKWDTEGCVVSSETTEDVVICLCDHLTSFGADFFVAPNPIDFNVIAKNIGNLANNLAVLLTLVVIFILFVVGIIYLRREDKKDIEKWSVAPLWDNKLIDKYFYQLIVKTGKASNAGTKSNIHFMISGQKFDTAIRKLSSKENMVFHAGGVVKVILATEKPLGNLNYMRIWHDNSGGGKWSSWFLDAILVTDLQTNEKFYFLCDDWLAIDQSDGAIDRVVMVAGTDEIHSFKNLFQASTSRDFSDGHLWFSMFSRPTKSNFTRVQRLACGVTLLLCTMVASAMFYGREAEDSDKQGKLEIGPIKFSVQQLIVSVQSSLIVIPVNILIVQLFRKLAPKKSGKDYVSKSAQNVLSTASLRNAIRNEEEDQENKKTEKKQGFKFPHWCLYIAWALVIVTTTACAGVVFLYSIMWGPERSNDWLTAIILSFVQSVFLIQPAKVVVMAVVFSVFVKRCSSSKVSGAVDEVMQAEEAEEQDYLEQLHVQLSSQEEWILRFPDDELDENLRDKMLPPDPKLLEDARIGLQKRNRMISTAYEIVSYILYVILLLMASNSSKDPNAYKFHKSLSQVFVDSGDLPFTNVRTMADFWDWTETSLIESLFAENWYNGKRVTWAESRFIHNRESFVVGPARLRQIRSVDDECTPPGEAVKIVKQCITGYDFGKEETKDFLPFWVRDYSQAADKDKTPWTYQNFLELEGFPFEGKLHVYGGGGYAAVLGNTARKSRSIISDLKSQDWIDRHTSAVFVEFTVYNANINLFGSVVLLFERSGNGAFEPYVKIYPLRLFDFVDGRGYVLVGIYVAFLIVLIYKWYRIVLEMKRQKLRYLKEFWNFIDFVSAILSLILIPLYAIRHIQSQYVLNKMATDPDKEKFLNFQFIVLWSDTFRFMVSFVVFFAIVKFVQLLKFNTRIQMLTKTLRISAVPLLYFAAMFMLYFCSFLFLSWLWFEQKIYAFSTILLAAEEMLVMMLGRFDFTEMKNADRMLGPVFFTSFTFCCSIALVNMFVVILDESIKTAKAKNENVANEFELVDFAKRKITETLLSYIPSALRPQKEKYAVKEEAPFASPEYIHYPHDVLSRRVDTIMEKVEELEKYWKTEKKLPTVAELESELAQMESRESFVDIRSF